VFVLGNLAFERSDLQGAVRLLEQAVGSFAELGDERWRVVATRVLASAYEEVGETL
jgi:hypothetical protein